MFSIWEVFVTLMCLFVMSMIIVDLFNNVSLHKKQHDDEIRDINMQADLEVIQKFRKHDWSEETIEEWMIDNNRQYYPPCNNGEEDV